MMDNTLIQQSERLDNLANYLKLRVKGLDDIAANNVIAELKEIADIVKTEAKKQNTIWCD